MVSHFRSWILKSFIYLMWFYFVTDFAFNWLAKLAKPHPVFGPTYLPRFLTNSIASKVHMKCLALCIGP